MHFTASLNFIHLLHDIIIYIDMKYYILLLVFMFTCTRTHCQSSQISPKLNIKTGILDNGLTYYLYNNESSRGHADLYLMQDVGSILEEDSQDGLAHFLEHMCFKGTESFPGRKIFDLMESKGLKNSINAYTRLEETVYYLKNIPTKDRALFDKCLILLYDWCDKLLMEDEQVSAERNVIMEELRLRRNLDARLKEATHAMIFKDSQYAKRFVIGTKENIRNFKKSELVRFYKDWYRADLQSIVVIGDIDIEEVEKKLIKLFSSLPKVDDPREKPKFTLKDDPNVKYSTIIDEEVVNNRIEISIRHKTDDSLYAESMNTLINSMFARRLKQLLRKDTLNLLSANISYANLNSQYDHYLIDVEYRPNRGEAALQSVLNLQKDILENGFNQEEFDIIAKAMINQQSRMSKFHDRLPNQYYFNKIKSNFIKDKNIYSAQQDFSRLKKTLKTISLNDIKDKVNKYFVNINKNIFAISNDKKRIDLSLEDIQQIEANSRAVKILFEEEKEENIEKVEIIKDKSKYGKIDSIEKLNIFETEKWVLNNGVTVYYQESEVDQNNVLVTAVSKGGKAGLVNNEYVLANMLPQFRSVFGLKNYTREQLDNYSAANQLQYSFKVEDGTDEFQFYVPNSNINSLFELLYATFTTPEYYRKEYDNIMKKIQNSLYSIPNDYKFSLKDSINRVKYGDSYMYLDQSIVDKLSFEALCNMYDNKFSDISNFDFYIIGGIGKKKAKKIAERYIGAVEPQGIKKVFKKQKYNFPKGYKKHIINFPMVENKAGSVFMINANKKYSYKEYLALNIASNYIQHIAQKLLREHLKGTYAVDINHYWHKRFLDCFGIDISFECNPNRLEELTEALNAGIIYIGKNGMKHEDLRIFKDRMKPRGAVRYVKDIGFYYKNLRSFVEDGEDYSDPNFMQKLLDSIDIEFMNKTLKAFMSDANIYNIIYRKE